MRRGIATGAVVVHIGPQSASARLLGVQVNVLDHAKRFWLSSCLSVVLDSRVAIQKQNAVTKTPITLSTKISTLVSFAGNGTSDEKYSVP